MNPEPFALTDVERNSVLWERLSAHYRMRLESLRAKNDADLPEAETAKVRGRIAEAKAFLALGEEKPEIRSPGARKA